MTLAQKPLCELLEEYASGKPAPGGGSAAALSGSLAAALVEMVAGLTGTVSAGQIGKEAAVLRNRLTALIDEDCDAFTMFISALPGARQEALKRAAMVPMETAEACYRVLQLAEDMARNGNRNAITDSGVGALLANAGVQGACLNVKINLRSIKDPRFRSDLEHRLQGLGNVQEKCKQIVKYVESQVRSL